MASKKNRLDLDVEDLCKSLEGKHTTEGWSAAKKWFQDQFGADVGKRLKFLDSIVYAGNPYVYNPGSGVQEFKVLQGDIIRSTLVKLPNQPETCIGNLACFEEVSYIENTVLQVADRVASLSDVGWHLSIPSLSIHSQDPLWMISRFARTRGPQW
ncbi:hypothetical protein WDW86_16720 [Bdellovibrionota bacterium FG-2]